MVSRHLVGGITKSFTLFFKPSNRNRYKWPTLICSLSIDQSPLFKHNISYIVWFILPKLFKRQKWIVSKFCRMELKKLQNRYSDLSSGSLPFLALRNFHMKDITLWKKLLRLLLEQLISLITLSKTHQGIYHNIFGDRNLIYVKKSKSDKIPVIL